MDNTIQIIDNYGKTINCFKLADASINNSDFINRRIKKLSEFFKQDVIKYLKLDNNFVYDLYFYESNTNNAFSTQHSQGYVIAFTTALFDTLYKRFELIFNKPEVRTLFGIDDDEEAKHFCLACFDYSTFFVALHELAHIINGHCSSSFFQKLFKKTGFLNEIDTSTSNNYKNFYSQVNECFADCSAAAILSGYIYKIADFSYENIQIETKYAPEEIRFDFEKFEFHMAIFSIYNLFLLFNENTPKHNDYLELTHPEPSIRIKYIIPFLMNCMTVYYRDWTQDEIRETSKNIYQACMNFDNIFYTNQNFINEINKANTSKGDNHCLKLINSIKNTHSFYQKRAIVKTAILPTVDESFLNIFKELQI